MEDDDSERKVKRRRWKAMRMTTDDDGAHAQMASSWMKFAAGLNSDDALVFEAQVVTMSAVKLGNLEGLESLGEIRHSEDPMW